MASVSLTRRAALAALAALAGAALPQTCFAQKDAVKCSEGTEKPRTAAPPRAADCHFYTHDPQYEAAFKRILVDNPEQLYGFPPVKA